GTMVCPYVYLCYISILVDPYMVVKLNQQLVTVAGLDPDHAVNCRLMMELYGRPWLRRVRRTDEVMDGTRLLIVRCFTGIPLSTHCNLYFSVTIYIPGSNTDIV